MPAEFFKRIDLDLIYPPFLERVLAVIADCRAEGIDYWAISGYRDGAEQAALYFQGRTNLYDKAGEPLPIVTDARPYYSPHQYGIAIDFARDADTTRAGLQPAWGNSDYDELGRQAKRYGLVWGGDFSRKDRPHIQWPGFVRSAELEPLKAIALAKRDTGLARLQRVWASLPKG